MTPSAPDQYRLIDEGARPLRARAPWNPLGLFFILVVSSPLLVPVTALMFWLNWGRLGFGEKQKAWALPTVLLAALPFLYVYGGHTVGLPVTPDNARMVGTFAKFALAYPYLMGQRTLFESQRLRRERTVPAIWLWGLLAAVLAFPVVYRQVGRKPTPAPAASAE